MRLAITAWHVIDAFITQNRPRLESGTAHLAVIYEAGIQDPLTGLDVGAPLPVRVVIYQPGLDLALLVLWDVTSHDRSIPLSPIGPLGFMPPVAGDRCYGFGYPHLETGPIVSIEGTRTVDYERTLRLGRPRH